MTAQEVYETAMGLMDEQDTGGKTDNTDTEEYKNRTLLILNALKGELYPYSDTNAGAESGKRPVCGVISDFTTPLDLDDFLAQSVMPYGLAAHLLLDENPSSASFFQQRYEELRDRYGPMRPSAPEDIADVYGGIGFNRGGMW